MLGCRSLSMCRPSSCRRWLCSRSPRTQRSTFQVLPCLVPPYAGCGYEAHAALAPGTTDWGCFSAAGEQCCSARQAAARLMPVAASECAAGLVIVAAGTHGWVQHACAPLGRWLVGSMLSCYNFHICSHFVGTKAAADHAYSGRLTSAICTHHMASDQCAQSCLRAICACCFCLTPGRAQHVGAGACWCGQVARAVTAADPPAPLT